MKSNNFINKGNLKLSTLWMKGIGRPRVRIAIGVEVAVGVGFGVGLKNFYSVKI